MSSLDFEEAGHKLMKIQLRPGQVGGQGWVQDLFGGVRGGGVGQAVQGWSDRQKLILMDGCSDSVLTGHGGESC